MRDERLIYQRSRKLIDKLPQKILKIHMRSRSNYYKVEDEESDDEADRVLQIEQDD